MEGESPILKANTQTSLKFRPLVLLEIYIGMTCFKNLIKPVYVDLIITNRPKSFQEPEVIETVLSDCHKMSLTVKKIFYNIQKPKVIQY